MLVEVYENKVNEQNGGATDPETSAENTKTRMAKSDRSRKVIWASGAVFRPIAARRSEIIDGDDVREPEYAESKEVFQPSRRNRRRQRHEQGGVGGASKTSRLTGTTAVDIILNTRILFHVSMFVWRDGLCVPTCVYSKKWVTIAVPPPLQRDYLWQPSSQMRTIAFPVKISYQWR